MGFQATNGCEWIFHESVLATGSCGTGRFCRHFISRLTRKSPSANCWQQSDPKLCATSHTVISPVYLPMLVSKGLELMDKMDLLGANLG